MKFHCFINRYVSYQRSWKAGSEHEAKIAPEQADRSEKPHTG